MTAHIGRINFYQKGLSSGIIFVEGTKKFEASITTVYRFLREQKVEGINLINMDCEGSELLVLRGAEETLRKTKVQIFCEIHHDFLKQLGQSIEDLVKCLQG